MSRPKLRRRICRLPEYDYYGPLRISSSAAEAVVMSVDEYEAIRLIDWEKLTQEECADRMQVARTTVQSIYNSARTKIADSLINGKHLSIKGGSFRVCDGNAPGCGGRGCWGGRQRRGRPTIRKS